MIENHLEIGGGVLFWSLSEWTHRDTLLQRFQRFNLDSIVPATRPPVALLREALDEVYGGPRILIRPLSKRDGFVVVREDRGESENHYQQELVARLDLQDRLSPLKFSHLDSHIPRVKEAYTKQLGRLHATQVSQMLVEMIEDRGGIRLRPTGAIYWLPAHRLEEWQHIAQAVEAASEGKNNRLYLLRHRMDQQAITAIRDALVHEVQWESNRIEKEVLSGELGEKALETRHSEASELREKVTLYEHLLETSLQSLHQVLDQLDQSTASATLLLAAQALNSSSAVGVE